MTPLELEQEGDRVRALVRSGIDKIRSAMSVVEKVGRELSAAEFNEWCWHQAKAGPKFLSAINTILEQALADQANQEASEALRRAKEAEEAAKRHKREEASREKHERRMAEIAAKQAEEDARGRLLTVSMEHDKKERKQARDRNRIDNNVCARIADSKKAMSLDQISTAVKSILKAEQKSWLKAQLQIAALLCKARDKFGEDDRRFGEWIAANIPDISEHDRAGYIQIGRNPELAKQIAGNSRSIRLIGASLTAAVKDTALNTSNIIRLQN